MARQLSEARVTRTLRPGLSECMCAKTHPLSLACSSKKLKEKVDLPGIEPGTASSPCILSEKASAKEELYH